MRLANPLKNRHGVLLGNIAARVAGLACVFAATLLLARSGGPAVVGVYALLHVLPGLIGTVVSCGLPVATPYFLAAADHDRRRLPSTLLAIAVVGGAAGAIVWVAFAPLSGALVFSDLSLRLDFILLSALTGPAVLGVYAIASKFAELIRILGMALQYVFYPTFAKQGKAQAAASARTLMPKFGLVSATVPV